MLETFALFLLLALLVPLPPPPPPELDLTDLFDEPYPDAQSVDSVSGR